MVIKRTYRSQLLVTLPSSFIYKDCCLSPTTISMVVRENIVKNLIRIGNDSERLTMIQLVWFSIPVYVTL